MKKIKNSLFFGVLILMFSSCSKCVECEGDEGWSDGTKEGGPYLEICKDNFENKSEYEDYVDMLEDNGYDCKSDFWN